MTPDEKLRLGQRAERLLTDDTFKDAMLAVDGWYRAAVFDVKLDAEGREALFAEYRGFQRAIDRLRRWKSDAEVVADELRRSQDA